MTTAETRTTSLPHLGRYALGLGLMAMGALSLAWGDFVTGQTVPAALPYRAALGELAGAFMFIAGAALAWGRIAPFAAAAVAGYFALVVAVLMNGAEWLSNVTVYGEYEVAAEQFAIASAALLIFAETAPLDARLAGRLRRIGQVVFGICAIVFGGAHFVYMNLTEPLVPKWLPPSQLFWAYATGVAHIIAGIAIATGIRGRLAGLLLALMYASFQPLVHIPMLLANPANHFEWCENAINLALAGAAWVIADSFGKTTSG